MKSADYEIGAALQDGLAVEGHWRTKAEAVANCGVPVRYDLATDSWVAVDQAWLDQWMDVWDRLSAENLSRRSVPAAEREIPPALRLKAYPNPSRDDCVFVAEDKPIAAYATAGLNGEQLYPPVPETPWSLRVGVEPSLGHEIVRRWNAFAESGK